MSVFVPYFNEISQVGSPLQRGQIYRGYTGNINILAYVMLIKIPFIIYYQIINKGNKAFTFLFPFKSIRTNSFSKCSLALHEI